MSDAVLPPDLESAFSSGRLSHAILLTGDALSSLQNTANALICRILETSNPEHPDVFTLRPMKKGRRIPVDEVRELTRKVYLTGHQGAKKVAVIIEADRLNRESSNALLKTLEEPPAGTTLLLLTQRPAELLPTIRSRCFRYRSNDLEEALNQSAWMDWKALYNEWLEGACGLPRGADEVARRILGAYGLVARFLETSEEMVKAAAPEKGDSGQESLSSEEIEAETEGRARGLRRRLLVEIAELTHAFGTRKILELPHQAAALALQLNRNLESLERVAQARELNLKEGVILENFFLQSVRIWSEVQN